MLQLTLRSEFRGRRLGGTAIEIENTRNTGATQMAAADFLELTSPSADALQSLEAVGPDRGRPLVLIGERGQGVFVYRGDSTSADVRVLPQQPRGGILTAALFY